MSQVQLVDVAITGTLSDSINLGGARVVGVRIPAGWTAATLTIQTGFDGATFQDLIDNTGELSLTAVAGKDSMFSQAQQEVLRAANYIKVRSGASGSTVNQTTSRALKLITRPYL